MIKRNTVQCALVLEAVNKLRHHATAEEIYSEIAREHPSISRATVYRNLGRLAQTGKIRKVSMPDGADRFDHLQHEHHHIRCEKCGRLFDADMDYIADLDKSIRDLHGFKLTGYDIIFKGICPECRENNGK